MWYDGEGIAGHAAFPEGTKNALAVLCGMLLEAGQDREDARVLKSLRHLCGDGYGREIGLPEGSTCNVGCVRMQGQQLRIELDIRYPVNERGDEILEMLRAFAGENGFQILRYEDSKPNLFPPESGLIRTDVD